MAVTGGGPRVLVTGFSMFPGEPVNPTEGLVERLSADPPDIGVGAFRAGVLSVDYATIGEQLSGIARDFDPDIAVHFGLARQCEGFRLETVARNSHAGARADRSGGLPELERVCAGPDTLPATLPLEAVAGALSEAGFAVQWSQDAGGYLCNTVFMLSAAHACRGLRPAMSGFIHVPPGREAEPDNPRAMALDDLVTGARLVVAACVEAWSVPGPSSRKRENE